MRVGYPCILHTPLVNHEDIPRTCSWHPSPAPPAGWLPISHDVGWSSLVQLLPWPGDCPPHRLQHPLQCVYNRWLDSLLRPDGPWPGTRQLVKDRTGLSDMDLSIACIFGVIGQTIAFVLFSVFAQNWATLNRLLWEMHDISVIIMRRGNNDDLNKTITARLWRLAAFLVVATALLMLYAHLMADLVYGQNTENYVILGLTLLAVFVNFPPLMVGNTVLLSSVILGLAAIFRDFAEMAETVVAEAVVEEKILKGEIFSQKKKHQHSELSSSAVDLVAERISCDIIPVGVRLIALVERAP